MKKKKIVIISIISSIVLIVAGIAIYIFLINKPQNIIVCELTRDEETKSTYTKTVAEFDKDKNMLNYQEHVVITYKTKEAYLEGKKIERRNTDQYFDDKKMTEKYVDYKWIFKYKDDSQKYPLEEYKKTYEEDGAKCVVK